MASNWSAGQERERNEEEEEEEHDSEDMNSPHNEDGTSSHPDDDRAHHGSSSSSGGGQPAKRQKVNHKPPPDALQHKFKPFVQAAFDMVSNPANNHAVRFSDDGASVEIIDVSAFSDKVLPRYFKHKNISSFIRQMNMYGFEKIDGSEGAIHTFKHEYFQRDQPQLLSKILRKPVKSHRRPGEEDDDAVTEILESKRAEAHQAADELARLKKAQALHEDRLKQLEENNSHLAEENARIKSAIVQVKTAQQAMTDRLRRLFLYFMRYYVRDEKAFEETVRGLLENANSASPDGGPLAITEPQRQVINSLFQLEDDPYKTATTTNIGNTTSQGSDARPVEDDLARNHSLASPWDAQPIMLPTKPRVDDSLDSQQYAALARDLAHHIDQNDVALRRIDSLASELQDVDMLNDDDLLDDTALVGMPSMTSISGPLPDDVVDEDDKLTRS